MENLIVTNDTFSALRFGEALLDEINEAELLPILERYPNGLEVLDNYEFLSDGKVQVSIEPYLTCDLEEPLFNNVVLKLQWIELDKLANIFFYCPVRGYFGQQQVEIEPGKPKFPYFKTKLGSTFFLKHFRPCEN